MKFIIQQKSNSHATLDQKHIQRIKDNKRLITLLFKTPLKGIFKWFEMLALTDN